MAPTERLPAADDSNPKFLRRVSEFTHHNNLPTIKYRQLMFQQGLRDRGLGFFGFVSVGHGGSLG